MSSRRPRPVLVEAANEAVGDGGEQLSVIANYAVGGALTVPTDEQMSLALASANDGESLKSLHDVVAALQKTAEQFKVAADEIGRIAVSRLLIERKLGAHLAQTVRRGGRGSKSTPLISIRGGASAGLPPGISPQLAAKYRKLADVPDEVFTAYLGCSKRDGRVPSANGARRFATKGGRRGAQGASAREQEERGRSRTASSHTAIARSRAARAGRHRCVCGRGRGAVSLATRSIRVRFGEPSRKRPCLRVS